MGHPAEPITLRFPRSVVDELPALAADLTDRMHALLERNTEGMLSAVERAELETLVRMAHFAQLLAMAADGPTSAA